MYDKGLGKSPKRRVITAPTTIEKAILQALESK
jgi:hypothetical protein